MAERVAMLPAWTWGLLVIAAGLLAVAAVLLGGGPAAQLVLVSEAWGPPWAWAGRTLATFLRFTVPLALAAACALAWWMRARLKALLAVELAPPDAATVRDARLAGAALAQVGPLGLVLAGGGAKGAYQVGCWQALRECGVSDFASIAGTSVGALNAVLVAQGDCDKAQAVWHDMHLGRVLRMGWQTGLAALIRVLLFPVYIARHAFTARAIPVPLWRAVQRFRDAHRQGEPLQMFAAALHLYAHLLGRHGSSDRLSELVLAAVVMTGASLWWIAAAPLLTLLLILLVAPLLSFLLVAYASIFVAMLDQLATRLVLASNEPLQRLLVECVDVTRLRQRGWPLFVTLARLGEVTRPVPAPGAVAAVTGLAAAPPPALPPVHPSVASPVPAPAPAPPPATGLRGWWRANITGDTPNPDFVMAPPSSGAAAPAAPLPLTTVEYLPTHFDLQQVAPSQVHELVLQSAGLPEIFPARCFNGHNYVDGGTADNVPLAALAVAPELPRLAAIVVMPLDAAMDEAALRRELALNLDRLGKPPPQALPELLLLRPSRPLGNFFTGTLDFGAHRARALMRLGHADTLRWLAGRAR